MGQATAKRGKEATVVNLFLTWLTASVPISQLWLYIIGAVILTFGWIYTVIAIAHVLYPRFEFYDARVSKITPFYLIGLFFWAFIEEIAYRFPLAILIVFGLRTIPVLIVAAVFSLIFGIAHGKLANILMQGGDGILWCLLFLKCGGLQGNYFQALLVTTTVHFICNFIITCPIPWTKRK